MSEKNVYNFNTGLERMDSSEQFRQKVIHIDSVLSKFTSRSVKCKCEKEPDEPEPIHLPLTRVLHKIWMIQVIFFLIGQLDTHERYDYDNISYIAYFLIYGVIFSGVSYFCFVLALIDALEHNHLISFLIFLMYSFVYVLYTSVSAIFVHGFTDALQFLNTVSFMILTMLIVFIPYSTRRFFRVLRRGTVNLI